MTLRYVRGTDNVGAGQGKKLSKIVPSDKQTITHAARPEETRNKNKYRQPSGPKVYFCFEIAVLSCCFFSFLPLWFMLIP